MKESYGFTLIELMITLGILAVVVTMAAPSMNVLIQNNRLAAQLNDFVGSLQTARSEAVKRGAEVTVCKSNNNTCTTAGGWEQGWLVFVDTDNDETYDAGTEDLVAAGNALSGDNTLTGNANVADFIKFDNRGFSQGYNGTVTLCDKRGAQSARGIVISNTGRIRRTIDSDADGLEEDGSGVDLACP